MSAPNFIAISPLKNAYCCVVLVGLKWWSNISKWLKMLIHKKNVYNKHFCCHPDSVITFTNVCISIASFMIRVIWDFAFSLSQLPHKWVILMFSS